MSIDGRKLSLLQALASLFSAATALAILFVGISIWRFNVEVYGAPVVDRTIGILSVTTFLLSIARYLLEKKWCYFAFAWGMWTVSIALLLPVIMQLRKGSVGGGTLVGGIAALITLLVFLIGLAGIVSGVIAAKEGIKIKAAQPGATDNPDDAKHLREDH